MFLDSFFTNGGGGYDIYGPDWGSFNGGFPDMGSFTNGTWSGSGGGGGGGGLTLSQTLSQLADGTEAQLRANLGAWQVQTISASVAITQAWALLDGMVAAMRQYYGAQGLKSAAERDRRIDPSQLRWDWIAYYIDPITGGPSTPPPVPGGSVGAGGGIPGGGGYPYPGANLAPGGPDWWLVGGVVVLAVLLLRK